MFHDISPRTEQARKDIKEGYYADNSIDIVGAIMAPDDDHLIVDGHPIGSAFVSGALPFMKGCPVCKTVHNVGESCLISNINSPIGTPNEEVLTEEETEVESMTPEEEKAAKAALESGEEPQNETPPTVPQGVSQIDMEKMNDELKSLRKETESLKFGKACTEIASKLEIKTDEVMAIVSKETTPEGRMTSLASLLSKVEEQNKKIVEAKVTGEPVLAKGDANIVDPKGDDVYNSAMFDEMWSTLTGEAPLPVDSSDENEGGAE